MESCLKEKKSYTCFLQHQHGLLLGRICIFLLLASFRFLFRNLFDLQWLIARRESSGWFQWGRATGLPPHHTVLSGVYSRSYRTNRSDSEEEDGEISKEKLEDTAPHLKNFFGSLSRVDDKAVTVPWQTLSSCTDRYDQTFRSLSRPRSHRRSPEDVP